MCTIIRFLRLTIQSTRTIHDWVKYVYNFANLCVGDSESGDDYEADMHFQFGLILVHC